VKALANAVIDPVLPPQKRAREEAAECVECSEEDEAGEEGGRARAVSATTAVRPPAPPPSLCKQGSMDTLLAAIERREEAGRRPPTLPVLVTPTTPPLVSEAVSATQPRVPALVPALAPAVAMTAVAPAVGAPALAAAAPKPQQAGLAPPDAARLDALHACTHCRNSKTKCDDGRPCGRCRRLGIQCSKDDGAPRKRSCANCHKAKVGCQLVPGETCGRCARFGLECVPHVAPARRSRTGSGSNKQPNRVPNHLVPGLVQAQSATVAKRQEAYEDARAVAAAKPAGSQVLATQQGGAVISLNPYAHPPVVARALVPPNTT
jgi:hypothetical protein